MAERRREGKTIRRIRRSVGSQQLGESFTAAAVNEALDITWDGTFLWKHRIGSGQTTELFERVGVERVVYRLSQDQQALVRLRDW